MSLTERLTENAPSFMAELLELEATVAPMAAAAATSARTRRYFSVFKRRPFYHTCLPNTCQFVRIACKSPVDRSLACVDRVNRAIDWLHRTWLPTSGYVPTEQPAFEVFLGRPFAHGDEYFELRAQLPVMRA